MAVLVFPGRYISHVELLAILKECFPGESVAWKRVDDQYHFSVPRELTNPTLRTIRRRATGSTFGPSRDYDPEEELEEATAIGVQHAYVIPGPPEIVVSQQKDVSFVYARPVYAGSEWLELSGFEWEPLSTLAETRRSQVAVKKTISKHNHGILKEHTNLKRIGSPGHRNIIQILFACIVDEGGLADSQTPSLNLVFPLALGDLSHLFSGSLNTANLHNKVQDLWGQFEGLASAIEYLHETCQCAHGNIEPSNILLYQGEGPSPVLAKIAGFGEWSNLDDKEGLDEEEKHDDTSMLGAVFLELLTYLILGADGVQSFKSKAQRSAGFREYYTLSLKHNEQEVLKISEWLVTLAERSRLAAEMESLLMDMIAKINNCPSASDTVNAIREMSFCVAWDGVRFVRVLMSNKIPTDYLRMSDRIKEKVERRLCSPIDWWPFELGRRSRLSDHTRIVWEWSGEDLYIDVPNGPAAEYKWGCKYLSELPLPTLPEGFSWSVAHTPSSVTSRTSSSVSLRDLASSSQTGLNQQPSTSQSSITQTQNAQFDSLLHSSPPLGVLRPGNSPSGGTQSRPGQTQPHEAELYWCVKKSWRDAKDTIFLPINAHSLQDDNDLFAQLNKRYTEVRGKLGRLLSWKSCEDISFIEFATVYDDEPLVVKIKDGLPPKKRPSVLPRYEYIATHPLDIHIKIAAKQIIKGMKGRRATLGSRDTVCAIPCHLFQPPMTQLYQSQGTGWKKGEQAWGICAIQGWAVWKVMLWIGFSSLTGLVIFAMWLAFVDNKDLQNASVSFIMVTTTMLMLIGVPQYLGSA
ncbi:hypothetical protein BCR34DRAFT_597813 [Clohesyomyces aquaticus]|uniref:Protein kinase domain-containing protein n=1 Tax=Clohesyomyces aquaticus TaxID=1231657 RepID=A0A1Y2A173_9PLEO|nr:hypothetical protein BCR34DRAFT_597813 [Clohesyomyces aquaticus]